MAYSKIDDLQAFVAVARDQSFTKAAAKLGVTTSALSHTIKSLEEKMGIRLLTRTTRNVSTTEAGERLLRSVGHLFDQIIVEVDALSELRDKPKGKIRITCTDDQIELCLRPMLTKFIEDYPEITIELYVEYAFANIVEERYDAGIRAGEAIGKDMIAVRLSDDWRLAVVGSPAYFEKNPKPKSPYELTQHQCINMRPRPAGSNYAWEFEDNGKPFTMKVEGPLVFNSIMHVMNSALDGIGLGYIPEQLAEPYVKDGRLIEVLPEWCPYFAGYHLYYPNRRHPSPAFSAFVQALKYPTNLNFTK